MSAQKKQRKRKATALTGVLLGDSRRANGRSRAKVVRRKIQKEGRAGAVRGQRRFYETSRITACFFGGGK